MKLVFVNTFPVSLGLCVLLRYAPSSSALAFPHNTVNNITVENAVTKTEVQCGIRISERRMATMTSNTITTALDEDRQHHHYDNRHRRMVSLDGLPQSCEESNVITIDHIPNDGLKRTFNKLEFSKTRNSGPVPSDYAYWSGEDSRDGSTFNFVQDEQGNMAGSMVDFTNDNVLQFHREDGGSYVVTITASSDFPPEGHPLNEDEEEEDYTHSGSGSVGNGDKNKIEKSENKNIILSEEKSMTSDQQRATDVQERASKVERIVKGKKSLYSEVVRKGKSGGSLNLLE